MNLAILKQLRANSRASWQQIGQQVHLSGQAVATRVQNMQEQGIISGFTIRENHEPKHFITVFMESSDFSGFENMLKNTEDVEAAYKVSGEGCYQVILRDRPANGLETFLNEILKYGRYRVSSSIRCVK